MNFDSEGRSLVTSSEDKTVKVWNLTNYKLRANLEGHDGPVRATGFHPGNTLVISGSDDCSMRVWDIESKQQLLGFIDHKKPITSVAFHPNTAYAASGGMDKKVKVYDIRSKKMICQFETHTEEVNQIAFQPSGNFLISTSNDSKIKVWDLRVWQPAFTLFGHTGPSRSVCFSPKGDYFATGGDDTAILIWKANFGGSHGESIIELPSSIKKPPVIVRHKKEKSGNQLSKPPRILVKSPSREDESIKLSFLRSTHNLSKEWKEYKEQKGHDTSRPLLEECRDMVDSKILNTVDSKILLTEVDNPTPKQQTATPKQQTATNFTIAHKLQVVCEVFL
mgnify:FL=1